MNTIQIALLMLVILLALPAGLLLAKATREELKDGRKAFVSIILVSIAVVLVSLFLHLSNEKKLFLVLSMISVAIISGISLEKSYNSKKIVVKKKIKRR
jgi:uncharacterized membrane protein